MSKRVNVDQIINIEMGIESLSILVPYNEYIGDLNSTDTHLVEVVEEWRSISNYSELYKISSFGRLLSLHFGKKILRAAITFKGYLAYTLSDNTNRKVFAAHRLVGLSFIENTHNYPQINHKNTIKKYNCSFNLEWCTAEQNSKHASKNNLYHPNIGSKNHVSKLTEQDVYHIKLMLKHNYTHKRIGSIFGVASGNIGNIACQLTWKHIIIS